MMIINDLLARIGELQQRIEPLMVRVEEARTAEARINSLVTDKNAKLYALNVLHRTPVAEGPKAQHKLTRKMAGLQREIDAVRDTINKLPQHALVEDIRGFLLAVRDALSLVPADQQRLKDIRSEIKRLPLILYVDSITPGFLAMGDAYGQLSTLKLRLDEFLPERTYEDRLKDRRRIVAVLQVKLGCKDRQALADKFLVDVSSIPAAIRGAKDHSGPTTEKKILEACQNLGIDTSCW